MCQQTVPGSPRTCVICQAPLIGRSDKVFCDIKCKNYYHAEKRLTIRTAVNETNAILAKNYIILRGLTHVRGERFTMSKLALARAGFNFKYVTAVIHENGEIHFGIYDLTYRFDKHERVIVMADKERAPLSPFVFERWSRTFSPYKTHQSPTLASPAPA